MKRYVLFDLDGTVADNGEGICKSAQYALDWFGIHHEPLENLRRFVGPPLQESFQVLYGFSPEEAKVAVEKYRERYRVKGVYENKLYPGIPALLRAVREAGVKTAVLSNKPDNMTCFIADALFPGLFDIVHGQRTGVPKKPDPAAVFEICDALGVQPAQCLYVGDSGVDMQTGANAGVPTAGVTWGFRGAEELRQNGADHLVDNAEALGRLIL